MDAVRTETTVYRKGAEFLDKTLVALRHGRLAWC